ncbi:hypothetical protein OnM2_093001 [Erysiphe neolycopersici]|uniref:Uncharacterized protein n=1 Tax=Erysiphe neolycopersici TaxID=212602 RepID=A0A420HBW1_9PEZI|nr:hypothetical protein OnM2_093001 [Erysiphe neolycopersici]
MSNSNTDPMEFETTGSGIARYCSPPLRTRQMAPMPTKNASSLQTLSNKQQQRETKQPISMLDES